MLQSGFVGSVETKPQGPPILHLAVILTLQSDQALTLRGITPTLMSFNAILDGCVRNDEVDKAHSPLIYNT